jgi:hypothetical protein
MRVTALESLVSVAVVVAATRALERNQKALFRLALGDLLERREILVACGGGDWLEVFQWHDSRNGEVLRLELRCDGWLDEVE